MMTLTHTTRIAVQVIVEDDPNNLAALVMAITFLVNLVVRLGWFVNQAALLVSDFTEAARFVTTVFTIGLKSLAWGFVGVRV